MTELVEIQHALKAPKDQKNNFGNYEYRSTEDILEAVKPLLKKHDCFLNLSDEIIEIGGRFYVKATAHFQRLESSKGGDLRYCITYGYAREPDVNKGMNGPQITAMCSSYARKLALNGMFLIDDSRETDGGEQGPEEPKEDAPIITKEKIIKVLGTCATLAILTSKYQKALELGFKAIPEIEKAYKENRERLQ